MQKTDKLYLLYHEVLIRRLAEKKPTNLNLQPIQFMKDQRIMARPNKTTQEIRESLTTIREALHRLEEQNKLMTQALAVRSKGTKPDITKDLESPALKLILKDIQDHPGAVRKEIAERTKLTPADVTKTVMALQDQDQIVRLGSRRTTRWFSPEVLKELTKK